MKTRLFLIILLLTIPAGCAGISFEEVVTGLRSGHHQGHYIENVPFIVQKSSYCGPASLATVLQYHGIKVTQDEIAGNIYSKIKSGSPNILLVTEAIKRGMWTAKLHRSDVSGIADYINEDLPVIVMGRDKFIPGLPYHFMVVVGYDLTKEVIIVNNGYHGNVVMSESDFITWWATGKPDRSIPGSDPDISKRRGPDKWFLLACLPDRLPSGEYIQQGFAAEKKGDKVKAEKLYIRGLETAGGHRFGAMARLNLGLLAFQGKDIDKAEEQVRLANIALASLARKNPKYMNAMRPRQLWARVMNVLAWILGVERDNLDEALILIKRATEIEPENKEYKDTLQNILSRLKKDKK